jgi:hypothetical protein
LRCLLIQKAAKQSEDDHLVAMFEPKLAQITVGYANLHLRLVRELGALDEEIQLIRNELRTRFDVEFTSFDSGAST